MGEGATLVFTVIFFIRKRIPFAKLALMALYEFAASTRKLLRSSLIGLTALFLLLAAIVFASNLYNRLNPLTVAPTVGFGKLPPLRLLDLSIEGNPTFTLETATGDLPKFENKFAVFAMKLNQPTLLDEDKAQKLAADLDFGGQGELSTNKRNLVFSDTPDKRTLTVDISSQNFTLETDLSRIETIAAGKAPSTPEAVKTAQEFLRRLGLLKFNFEEGNQTTNLKKIEASVVKEAGSISEAQFTEVNFFRSLTEASPQTYPILPLNPNTGLIQFWLTTSLQPNILNNLRISYNTWEIDKTKVETYPLKNVSEAWEEVKNKNGIALSEAAGPLERISITEVYLAYFDGRTAESSTAEGGASFDEAPSYLQPIYVFSGLASTTEGKEGKFTAYIQAVSDEWVLK